MNAAQIIVNVLLIITSLIMIVTVLLQSSESDGMGAISGGSDSYFGKNKSKSFEGKLALATKISAGVFIALALSMIFIH
jgi:preprotein translocase subunit SecG